MLGEVLGVEQRRRRWSDDEKLEILLEVGFDGASVMQVAQRHELTRSQVYGWRRNLKKKGLWSPDRGAVFVFRGRKGDRLKLLYWDGQGFCLYYRVLERGRFPWPNTEAGVARLIYAQLAMLWEGIDWRRPDWGAPSARAG